MKSAFATYRPRFGLARFVDVLWHADGPANEIRESVLPNAAVEWIFNVGPSPHLVLDFDGEALAGRYRRRTLFYGNAG